MTADGIEIVPLYVADGGRLDPGYPGRRRSSAGAPRPATAPGWDARQRHEHPDPAVVREKVMEDLEWGGH